MNLSKRLTTRGMTIGICILFSVVCAMLLLNHLAASRAVFIGGGAAPADAALSAAYVPIPNPFGDTIEVNEWVTLGGLTVLIGAFIVGAGMPLVFLFRALDSGVASVKEDDAFKSAIAARSKREKDTYMAFSKSQPPDPIPSHDRPNWSIISTSLCMGMLFAFLGAAYSGNFMDARSQGAYAFWFAIAGILIGLVSLNSQRIHQTEADEGSPMPGSVIWVLVTGTIVVGLGAGVMMWVRAGGV